MLPSQKRLLIKFQAGENLIKKVKENPKWKKIPVLLYQRVSCLLILEDIAEMIPR